MLSNFLSFFDTFNSSHIFFLSFFLSFFLLSFIVYFRFFLNFICLRGRSREEWRMRKRTGRRWLERRRERKEYIYIYIYIYRERERERGIICRRNRLIIISILVRLDTLLRINATRWPSQTVIFLPRVVQDIFSHIFDLFVGPAKNYIYYIYI